jgi:hypothetical protein
VLVPAAERAGLTGVRMLERGRETRLAQEASRKRSSRTSSGSSTFSATRCLSATSSAE